MTTLNLLLGGPTSRWPDNFNRVLAQSDKWIGVDRGAWYLVQQGIEPLLSLGDFDSLSLTELAAVKAKSHAVKTFPPAKDDTDTELALDYSFNQFHADRVVIYGGTGGRLDHLILNLILAWQPRFVNHLANIVLIDRDNEVSFLNPGSHTLMPQFPYSYIAFGSFGSIEKLSLKGARYPLSEYSQTRPFMWSSNEFIENYPIQVSFEAGILMVIRSGDNQ